jgi:hypothetical protein
LAPGATGASCLTGEVLRRVLLLAMFSVLCLLSLLLYWWWSQGLGL